MTTKRNDTQSFLIKAGERLCLSSVLESTHPDEFLYKYALKYGRLSKEWERLFLSIGNAFSTFNYARDVVKGRWEEGEKIIFTSPEWMFRYAVIVLNDKLPYKAENKIAFSDWWGPYITFCMRVNKRNKSLYKISDTSSINTSLFF